MKLFTVGPVEMYDHTRAMGSRQNEYFREPEFSAFLSETSNLLKQALFAPQEYHTIFLASSGTGAMEATVINCFNSADKLLIINGGTFGNYFVNICKKNKIPYDEVILNYGEMLTKNVLDSYSGKKYTALLVNICETSTGQLYDIKLLDSFCKRNGMYLIVDAISSAFADEYKISNYKIHATILSSQKALALPPGLAMVVLSDQIYEERVKISGTNSMYFDFKAYVNNMTRGQTPFTPCIGLLYQLNDMLKHLLEQGIDNKISRTHTLATYFRKQARKNNIQMPVYPLANAVTPVLFSDINAFNLHEKLRDQYSIYINPNGLMPERICRIGHLGNLTEVDYDLLITAINDIMSQMKKEKYTI